MKNDYDNTSQENLWTRIRDWVTDWISRLLAKICDLWEKIADWTVSETGSLITGLVISIIVSSCIITGCVGLAKLSERNNDKVEKQWTIQDSTFVEKQDGMYIYKRTIDGHQMYLMTDHRGTKQFVHSPNCDCDTIQYVP